MAVLGIFLFSGQGIQDTMPALTVLYRLQHSSRLQNNLNNGVSIYVEVDERAHKRPCGAWITVV